MHGPINHPNKTMSWNIIPLAKVPPSPWRNGGGVTRELAAWPDSQDWVWRISVAEVEASGPFSCFAGVQRCFAVLQGAGVRLRFATQQHELTEGSEPLAFDGADAVDCDLLDGATQDFNLMVRRDRGSATLRRVRAAERFVLAAEKTVAIYANSLPVQLQAGDEAMPLPAHSLAWQTLPAGTVLQVEGSDALCIEISTWD
jgi:environmental stress-induced protein Ves